MARANTVGSRLSVNLKTKAISQTVRMPSPRTATRRNRRFSNLTIRYRAPSLLPLRTSLIVYQITRIMGFPLVALNTAQAARAHGLPRGRALCVAAPRPGDYEQAAQGAGGQERP